ncbi:MAG: glycosyltransferase family 4 protein [Methylobacterium sp.]|jgi:glycosyltransferase involved in cell wall biosynthesis|nr:glycosyltransferase family 4 protein [Methylobacterium sp.]MCA3597874.1 glycosyltransferase family 4 protein [Methylobacterium sp.]MCA3604478.1 glycosyltransferase family 4 protein [Methylobacterium sp.]MCA3604880.1 glycosyltransferase family 4 protein [Methylobacterium sp.]MCA3608694.1 glycosyltransferase family 4 protein [Methylobacterium sp.]
MVFSQKMVQPLSGRTILQIIPMLDAGGAERTTIDIAEGIAQAGARSLVATEGGRLVGELQAKGGVWIPFPAATKNPLAMALNVGKLSQILKAEKVDLVHARSRAPAWVALAACRLAGTGFMTTYHGAYSGLSAPKLLYNSVMARGEVVIANSHFTAERIQAQFRMNPTCLRVIHRGTNFETFSPDKVSPARVEKIRRGWLVAPEERVVLLAGRLTPWKGQKVLIRAAQVLRERGYRDLVFILAGDPQGRDGYVMEIDQLISENQLGGVVRRVGHVSDMPAALAASALVAVPSTAPEAFGRVAVEAQAMGVPVVVSNLGAVPETVLAPPQVRPDQRTGWRVAPDNPEELADAIAEAIDLMPSTFQELADRARTHVMARFSLERMVSETLDCYSALLAERQNR